MLIPPRSKKLPPRMRAGPAEATTGAMASSASGPAAMAKSTLMPCSSSRLRNTGGGDGDGEKPAGSSGRWAQQGRWRRVGRLPVDEVGSSGLQLKASRGMPSSSSTLVAAD